MPRPHPPPLRWLLRLVLAWILAWTPALQAARQVTLVLSDNTPLYQEAAQALSEELEGDKRVWRVNVQSLAERRRAEPEDLVIPLGLKALRAVLAEPASTPVWSLLVPRQSFEQLAATTSSGRPRALSALYLDQPLARHLAMLQAALPGMKRLGVLFGPTSSALAAPLKEAAAAARIEVLDEAISRTGELIPTLDRLRGEIDALILLPDPVVLNRATLQALLLHTYHLRLPVAAYSTQLIEAGAMLALFTSPEQIGREAGRILRALPNDGNLVPPAADYPESFEVAVNRSVALSLDIRVPTSDVVRQRMTRKGGR